MPVSSISSRSEKLLHLAFQFRGDVLAFAAQLEQRVEVGGQARDFRRLGNRLFQALAILHHLL